jgi:hypothetical protein
MANHVERFLRLYFTEVSFLREEGYVNGNYMVKKRGIRVEGLPNTGVSYKGMIVDAIACHPMVSFYMELVNYTFHLDSNNVQLVLIPPNMTIENSGFQVGMKWHGDTGRYLLGNERTKEDIFVATLNFFFEAEDSEWNLAIRQIGDNTDGDMTDNDNMTKYPYFSFGNNSLYYLPPKSQSTTEHESFGLPLHGLRGLMICRHAIPGAHRKGIC